MEDRTKIALAAALLGMAGLVTAPAYTAAMAEQLGTSTKHPKITVVAPTSSDALGTIWFDVTGVTGGVLGGGPR